MNQMKALDPFNLHNININAVIDSAIILDSEFEHLRVLLRQSTRPTFPLKFPEHADRVTLKFALIRMTQEFVEFHMCRVSKTTM